MRNSFFEALEQRQFLSAALLDGAAAAALRAGAGTVAVVHPLQPDLRSAEISPAAQLLPAATLRAWPVTTAGATHYTLKVNYAPSFGGPRAIATNQSIVVWGPQGYRQLAVLVSTKPSSDGGIAARYAIRPPGGAWSASDNGTYAVMLRTGPLGQRVRSQLGTFSVAIDDGTPAPANEAPTFTAGPGQTVQQDTGPQTVANWATGMSAGPASEAGQTLTFLTSTNNDAIFATKPAIGSDGTLTYTPAAGASGTATVTVQLKDSGGTANGGVDTSAAQSFTITVTPTPVVVNVAPGFTTGANQTVAQDSGAKTVANWATNISAGPASEAGQTLTFLTSTNNDALFAAKPVIAANGTLTFTPAAGASGVATVTVQLKDNGGTANGGVDTSAAKTFTITVTPTPVVANQAPTFTAGANQSVPQDSGAKTVANWATNISAGPASEAGQTLTFLTSTNNDALFAAKPVIAANGTLTFTPAAGVTGVATVTVQLKDSGGTANGGVDTSASQTFTITVTPVNHAPSFTAGANQTVAQDSGAKSVASWATNISAGPASEASQTLTFVTSTNNDALFAVKPTIAANGTLSFTPAAGASGVATVTVQLKDNGGTANGGVDTSAAQTFTVTVTPTPVVNHAPSFTAGPNQTVAQDSGAKTVASWATNISAGAGDTGQTLTFVTSTNNDALFAVKPTIAANGTLTFTPAAGASGTATVTVQLKDSGGTANGGVDTSTAKTFTITVTPAAPAIPSMVGTYTGTLVIPAVGHNKSATLTITNQTAGGAITGTLVSGNVSLNVTGNVAANGTFTMSMATPPGTAHAGGAIALTTSGTVVAVGQQMVLALNFTLPAAVPGTLTVTRK